MARQSLSLGVVAVALMGCNNATPYGGAFEVPVASAVLQPEVGGPFLEPVGFVANQQGGQIVQLALKQGRFLTDDPTVSYLRTNQLPTGDDRVLGSVAVYAPEGSDEVTVFAGDQAFGQLLRVPYIVGEGPTEATSRVVNEDVAVPDGHQLTELSVKNGYTTTETWTLTYSSTERAYFAQGTRSGYQVEPIRNGEEWSARDRRLNLTLSWSGDPASGASIVIETDSGLTEHDVGGIPTALAMAPDQSLLAVVIEDADTGASFLWWFDPATLELTDQVGLPDGAAPHRLAWSQDRQLLVADRDRSAAYVVAPGETTATELVLPWPTLDVASLTLDEGTDDEAQVLYVVPLDGSELWMVDRATNELLDINGLVPGVQGMPFPAPIAGIESMEHSFLSSELTDDGLRRRLRAVAVADVTGGIVFAEARTGCLVQDPLGPRTSLSGNDASGSSTDFQFSFSDDTVAGPVLEPNASDNRSVVVHPCAGIARDEQWTLIYDQNQGAWQVEGTVSGLQQGLAFEDERYVSDLGEVSFVILGGAQPSQDGWEITFTVDDGAAQATGNFDNSDNVDENAVRVPGDPTYFFYRVGLAGATDDVSEDVDWYPVDIRPFVLVPGGATNLVGRVNPQIPANAPTQSGPEIEVAWE